MSGGCSHNGEWWYLEGLVIMASGGVWGFNHNGEWWCLEGLVIMASGGISGV